MWKFKIEGLNWKEIALIQKGKRKQKYKLRTKLKTMKYNKFGLKDEIEKKNIIKESTKKTRNKKKD